MPRAVNNDLSKDLTKPERRDMSKQVPLQTSRKSRGSNPPMVQTSPQDDNIVVASSKPLTIPASPDAIDESGSTFQKALGRVPAVQPDIDYDKR